MEKVNELRYMRAACHLYGVVSLKEMARLIEVYTGLHLRTNVLENCLKKNASVLRDLRYTSNMVYSDIYFENDADAASFLKEYGSYKKYMPDMDEFLRYANEQYYEKTPAIKDLEALLLSFLPEGHWLGEACHQVVDNVVYSLQADIEVEEVLAELVDGFSDEQFLFYLPNFQEQQKQSLKKQLEAVDQSLRRISLRGFSQAERQEAMSK